MFRVISTTALYLALVTFGQSAEPYNRIRFNGQDLFLNGLNLAWSSFANDIGPNPHTPDLQHFEKVFRQMQINGGNSMRLWLHTTGRYSPEWDGHRVIGPGEGTIEDLKAILDLAWEYDVGLIPCLWSFDMLRISNGSAVTDRAYAILTQEQNRQSYIENSLIPMVKALKGHPAIIAWEIFNEPEGMSEEHGWAFNRHVPMSDIQAFVNTCTGAIHRTDPSALVSNGSWAFIASTDVGEGNFNYYTDERLIKAGGDPDGTLDFYMVHYYDWIGAGSSPFHFPSSHWELDKPLVIAEFFPDCDNCGEEPHVNLLENGYAGSLGWSWDDRSPGILLEAMAEGYARLPAAIDIARPRKPEVELLSPEDGTWFAEGVVIPLIAEASDPDGTVVKVSFLVDGEIVAEDTNPPFEQDLTHLAAGHYTVMARVIDDTGERAHSSRAVIKVGQQVNHGRLEAEEAEYEGVVLRSDQIASGGAFLDMRGGGSILWTVPDVPSTGTYSMRIGFNLSYNTPKTNLFSINGGSPFAVPFQQPPDHWLEQEITVSLQQGTNTVKVTPSWGWMYFDYISFPFMDVLNPLVIETNAEWVDSGVEVIIMGPPGITYDLMVTQDLVSWKLVDSIVPLQTPAKVRDTNTYQDFARFYRILSNGTE